MIIAKKQITMKSCYIQILSSQMTNGKMSKEVIIEDYIKFIGDISIPR